MTPASATKLSALSIPRTLAGWMNPQNTMQGKEWGDRFVWQTDLLELMEQSP